MKIYCYQNQSFPDAVSIEYRENQHALTLFGATDAVNRRLRSVMTQLFGYPVTGEIQTNRTSELQPLQFAIALAIKTASMEGEPVLVIGTSDLQGRLVISDMPYQYQEVARRYHCALVLAPSSWKDSYPLLRNVSTLTDAMRTILSYHKPIPKGSCPLDELIGLSHVKRAMMIALAGSFHVLLFGPPGTGKSRILVKASEMLIDAPRFQVTPTMDAKYLEEHHIETLTRGGIVLADELPRLKQDTRTSLLSMMDSHETIVASAMNNCPCGAKGMNGAICSCSESKIKNYWDRIGYAMLDRYDIRLPVPPADITGDGFSKMDTGWKEKLRAVRALKHPFGEYEKLAYAARRYLNTHLLSPRSLLSLSKLVRTIADWDGTEIIKKDQFMEAYGYKRYGLSDLFWK